MKKYTYQQYRKDVRNSILAIEWDNPKAKEVFDSVSANYWKSILKRANSKEYVEAVRKFFGKT